MSFPMEGMHILSSHGDEVSFKAYSNNDDSNETLIALVTLKNIFSRQLPKMPKEYIVRLVFDRRHTTLAILKGGKVIGGVCYRPYLQQRFAEIAFLAISSQEQVRGYGTALMNELKNRVQKMSIDYFLTFADNFAIGYFQKQGFSKNISMNRERWTGFIKEYDGGTLMECYVHPNVNYLQLGKRDFILRWAKQRSQSHVVYPSPFARPTGCDTQEYIDALSAGALYTSSIVAPGASSASNSSISTPSTSSTLPAAGGSGVPSVSSNHASLAGTKRLASALDAPGVFAAGWTMHNHPFRGSERDRSVALNKLYHGVLKPVVERLRALDCAWPFKEHVDRAQVPDYFSVVSNAVDLTTISNRLREGDYYRSKEMLLADLIRMVSNCLVYNPEGSEYHSAALDMRRAVLAEFADVVEEHAAYSNSPITRFASGGSVTSAKPNSSSTTTTVDTSASSINSTASIPTTVAGGESEVMDTAGREPAAEDRVPGSEDEGTHAVMVAESVASVS